MFGRLLGAVAVVGLEAAYLFWVAGFWPDGHRAIGVLVGAALFLAAAAVETVIHEFGHLVTAVALRVRVRGMRLFGATVFGRNAGKPANVVTVDLLSMRRLASLRTVAFCVGGSAANLITALVALPFALDVTRAPDTRTGAAGVVLVGASTGLANLIPFTNRGSASDGQRVLNVLTGRQAAQVADRRALQNLRTGRPAYAAETANPAGNTPVPVNTAAWSDTAASANTAESRNITDPSSDVLDRLRQAVDLGSPDVARKAGAALAKTLISRAKYPYTELYDEVPRLVGLARRPGMDPAFAVYFASAVAWAAAFGELRVEVTSHTRLDPRRLPPLLSLAQAGFAVAPNDLIARNALGLVLALLDRHEDIRRLYVGLSAGGRPSQQATAHAIRALAEADLGDLAQAGRLVSLAEATDETQPIVRLSRMLLTAYEARAATNP